MNQTHHCMALQETGQKKAIAAMICGIAILPLSFLPWIEYQIGFSLYRVNGWQLLFSRGLLIENQVVPFSFLSRSFLLLFYLCVLLGFICLLFKRPKWASLCYAVCALSLLLFLLENAALQSGAGSEHLQPIQIHYFVSFFILLIPCVLGGVLSIWSMGSEKLAESVFLIFACLSVGCVFVITLYMFCAGAPAIRQIGLFHFLFGTKWDPGRDLYGIFPLILSSILATLGAILLGVPIGILTAVFLAEFPHKKAGNAMRPAVELLAGIPSVIYGFFGMLLLVPIISKCFPEQSIGDSLLAVILILAIMVLPTIITVSETALRAVPQSYREASMALGATPIKTIFKITIPAARSGILAGVVLGVGRAIGETMAVIMVAGNVANLPRLLGTVRLMTTGIVLEMSYSSGLHRQALFAIGLILFVFIMIVNFTFLKISKKGVQIDEK